MDITDNWPFDRIQPSDDEAIHDLLKAVETELDRIDVQADELQQQRFINTATDQELEKLAAEVGVTRETGESEERFRFRASVAKFISSSDGTFPSFAQLLRAIFDDKVANIDVIAESDSPVIQLRVSTTTLDTIPVSQGRLEQMLDEAVPASDGVEIVTENTFILGESGDQGLGNGQLS